MLPTQSFLTKREGSLLEEIKRTACRRPGGIKQKIVAGNAQTTPFVKPKILSGKRLPEAAKPPSYYPWRSGRERDAGCKVTDGAGVLFADGAYL